MIYGFNLRCSIIGGAAVGALAVAQPVLAQQTTAPAPATAGQLEEVVVTASRIESPLQRTPVAVTAFTANALAERGVTNLLDVANFTPSLVIGSRSGAGTNSGGVAIRGVGVDGGAQAAVGVYVDDVYYPSSAGNLLNLLDLDRVEVLRGPQGTLFGRNTIGGAIQYVTTKPGPVFGGFIEATGGNDDRADVHLAVNVPFGDKFAARLMLASDNTGGYVKDILNNTMRGADKNQQARLQARWTPIDRLTVDLKFETFADRTNGRALEVQGYNNNAQFVGIAVLNGLPKNPLTQAVVSTANWTTPGFNGADFFHAFYKEGQAIETYKLSDNLTLKSITAYSWTQTQAVTDIDDTQVPVIAALGGPLTTKLFTQELQLSGHNFSDRLKWTVGAYYFNSDLTNIGSRTQFANAAPIQTTDDAETKITSYAGYGQATYNFSDKWSVLLGLRYSHETNGIFDLKPANSALQQTGTFSDVSPAAGLNYQANADTLYYIKASKGFRAGGEVFNTSLPTKFLFFQPETAWTYEAGARFEFMNRRLRFNPTVFYTDWKNLQINLLVPTPVTVVTATQNAGNARLYGAEFEGQFAATETWLFTGSVSLLNARFTSVNPAVQRILYLNGYPGPGTTLPNLSTADEMQRAPAYKLALGARYTYPLNGGAKVVTNLDFSATAKQRSAYTRSDFVEMPAYTLLNGRLEYDAANGPWSVALFATNLTNEHYYIGGVNFAGGYTTGALEYDPGRPREYGVNLKARF